MAQPTRSVVSIDVGATNVDIVHFAPDLSILDKHTVPARRIEALPYLSLDVDAVVTAACAAISTFDQAVPVDAIVPCTHGSALALLDKNLELAFPLMSYLAQVPDTVADAYRTIEPDFASVFAPTNPGALTLGRQLLWQQTLDPEEFQKVRHILPYAQYLAFRLCGKLAGEITSLGAQTHLWAPLESTSSDLAQRQGWADRVPPLTPANAVLGTYRNALRGRGEVLCGLHDSSASFLQYAHLEPIVLLSTGTWIVAFDTETALSDLASNRDQVANVRVDGRPISCARFMGGEEFSILAGAANTSEPNLEDVMGLIAKDVMAFPSFTDSGGPMPGTGGQGRIVGNAPQDPADKISLATLYTAQMTSFVLDKLGDTSRVVVDGVFARNAVYLTILAALLPNRDIFRVTEHAGSARGAASLALSDPPKLKLAQVKPCAVPGIDVYHARWLDCAQRRSS